MQFKRVLSAGIKPGQPVEDLVQWTVGDAKIVDGRTGKTTHDNPGVEVPAGWSQRALNILSKNYLRRAQIPSATEPVLPQTPLMPAWLTPRRPTADATYGAESSARQVFHRLAGAWTYHAWQSGTIKDKATAQVFYDELYLSMAWQFAVPNSPQWFNTGLWWAYGIDGPDNGMWYVPDTGGDPQNGAVRADAKPATNCYERPQPHACFLTPIGDNLVKDGGIMDAVVREARIFKYGSGSGINASSLRAEGEELSSGGVASGAMSWLSILDKSAGAIKSGGTTRRAAKMVMLDDDHPQVGEFVDWKATEEHKAASMYVGSSIIAAYSRGDLPYEWLEELIPPQTKDRLKNGFEAHVFGIGYEEEANKTIDGQNSNNSVRLKDAFLHRAADGGDWQLTARTTGAVMKTIRAEELWDRICASAWACADPGLIFDDTVNAWNTCAADGRIKTTNPCAEFHHLDGSACLLASLRLVSFLKPDGTIDVVKYVHVCRLWTIVLDVSVSMASFPSWEFAVGAHNYRTLGLGYADLGGLLMRLALSYDSDEGRALAAALTALLTGTAYLTSAELAEELGPFPRWTHNEADMRMVLRNHARAVSESLVNGYYEGLNVVPPPESRFTGKVQDDLEAACLHAWRRVLEARSFRNAQVSLLAPTGTISFVMDCDTTGVECELSLIKYKNIAGGGTMEIVNPAIPTALRRIGCDDAQVQKAMSWVLTELPIPDDVTGATYRRGTLEGIDDPMILANLAVFDCANPAPFLANARYLEPMAHVRMVAACQPHLTGAISKTINLPPTATIPDVSKLYRAAHGMMVKAVALYRDGSKLAQPLQTAPVARQQTEAARVRATIGWKDQPEMAVDRPLVVAGDGSGSVFPPSGAASVVTIAERPDGAGHQIALKRGEREPLPSRRKGITQKARIGGQTAYWRTGEYPDGRLGEVFIDLAGAGSTLDGFANVSAKLASLALQYGAPPEEVTDAIMNVKFEPSGSVELHDDLRWAHSIPDLIARDLAINYLGREDLSHKVRAVAIGTGAVVALDRTALALALGQSTGETCRGCGGLLVPSGNCMTCSVCGDSGGCV